MPCADQSPAPQDFDRVLSSMCTEPHPAAEDAAKQFLAAELRDLGYDVVDPELPLVAVDVPASEFDALREDGWRLSRTASGELHVVCMPHVTREMLASVRDDLAEASRV